MATRPSFIIDADWKLLCDKYNNDQKINNIIKRIENGYPIQYAIGNVEFLKNKILVNKNVLVPRFETEILVDKLIKYIKKYEFKNFNILDLCTGSGCIAISLKKEFSNANITAIDISYRALLVAKKNAKINDVKISFKRKNVLSSLSKKNMYSILVSNPPYVKLGEEVSRETNYEPRKALYPGKDDIVFYKKILEQSKYLLYKKSIIAFEIGSTQAERICKFAKKIYPKSVIAIEKDYNGYDRFIFIFNECE